MKDETKLIMLALLFFISDSFVRPCNLLCNSNVSSCYWFPFDVSCVDVCDVMSDYGMFGV